jgi:hypothetical protein
MKYIKVKKLQKMLAEQDPEAEIFFNVRLPKPIRKVVPHLSVNLNNPAFTDPYTDIDGTKTVWCYFDVKLESM